MFANKTELFPPTNVRFYMQQEDQYFFISLQDKYGELREQWRTKENSLGASVLN